MGQIILNKKFRLIITLSLICVLAPNYLFGEELVRVLNLSGDWKFSIGERDEWTSLKFSDSGWESIRVPSAWENQGFNGYNGFAFYRKSVVIPTSENGRELYLFLGYIDDVDEAYINGHKIGSTGSFPPGFETAYNAERKYTIPGEFINYGATNVIAVKVYDSYNEGGIVSGNVGIYAGKMSFPFDQNLQGLWKFRTGDDLDRKTITYDDNDWDAIQVPAKWEDQRYRDYDGYAWYRKTFVYKPDPSDNRMVLLLGKIDDIDQVFINGILVGSTGVLPLKSNAKASITGEEYNELRGYYIPTGVLKSNQKNLIAVRVFDSWGSGGIYEGPVGLLTQTKYIDFWRKNKERR